MFKGLFAGDERDEDCLDGKDAFGQLSAMAFKQLRSRCVKCLQRQSRACSATAASCSFVSESKLP